jgi:hypothetical protein
MAIPASELAQLQTDLAANLDKTCQIYASSAGAADGYGSPALSYPQNPTATVQAGMRQPTANELQNYSYAIADKDAWVVRLPYGTSVKAQDHLVIEGNTLEVHILLNPHSVPGLLSVIAAQVK